MTIPKIFFTYWEGDQLSILHYYTILSLLKYNPEIDITIYTSLIESDVFVEWKTDEHSSKIENKISLDDIININPEKVKLEKIDFENQYKINNNISCVYKADYTRIIKLYEHGGIWFDMDILFIKKFPEYIFKSDVDVYLFYYEERVPTGLVMSSLKNSFITELYNKVIKNTKQKLNQYQTIGPTLFTKIYDNILYDVYIYPYIFNNINDFFTNSNPIKINDCTFGIHWYNGSQYAKDFINSFDKNNIDPNRSVCEEKIFYLLENDITEFWDKNHKKNDNWWLSGENSSKYILDLHKINVDVSNLEILDIGIGMGHLVKYLSKNNTVYATDISTTALERVKDISKIYKTTEIKNIEPVDIAISNLVFQHCDDAEVKRIIKDVNLKDEGYFSFQFAFLRDDEPPNDMVKYNIKNKTHYFRSLETILNFIEESGKEVLSISEPIHYYNPENFSWYIIRIKNKTKISIKNKKIMLFGGSGSLGNKFIEKHIKNNTIVNYSRDECKHWKMSLKYKTDNLSFIIGDVRDYSRVENSILREQPNIIVIMAALKHIDRCEFAIDECVKTNFTGTMNILNVIESNVDRLPSLETIIFVSTDKACEPTNVYGMAKALSESAIVEKSLYCNKYKFVNIRYGNVLNSRGSIIPILHEKGMDPDVENFTLTHPDMTRFVMTLEQSVALIDHAILHGDSGDTIIPKLVSMKLIDLMEIFSEKYKKPIKITGLRPGEKMLESLISETQSMRLIKGVEYMYIKPPYENLLFTDNVQNYNSKLNPLNKEELYNYLNSYGLL